MASTLIVIIIVLAFSGFFSGMEIAFLSANKLRMALKNQQGTLSGKILAKFNQNPANFIGTILIGNNIAMVVYGTLMAKFLEPKLSSLFPQFTENELMLLLTQTILSTLIVLIFGEFLPKSFFRLTSDKTVYMLALPMQVFYTLLYPFVFLTVNVASFFLKYIFGIKVVETKHAFEKNDLALYVQESNQIQTEEEDAQIDVHVFQKALNFNEVKVRDCMVHRTSIVGIDVNVNKEELREKFVETEHSKIFVYEETIDNIIGFVHFMTLFQSQKPIREMLHEPLIVTETMLAHELLKKFNKEGKSIAIVVDEFGGTSGIISLEDVVEEIFGEIEDEHDISDLAEEKVDDTTYVFSAQQEIDYLNEKYDLKLPEGDYSTIGGLIVRFYESIPAVNEEIIIQNFKFIVLEASANKIEKVRLTLIDSV